MSGTTERRAGVHPLLERAAAYSWRLLVCAAAVVALLWLVGQLWVVLMALVIAALLSRVLSPPCERLRARGWRPGLAAFVVLIGFLLTVGTALTLIGVASADQIDDIGPTVSRGIDDIERWLVEDAPVDISRADIESFRSDASEAFGDALRRSSGSVVAGAVVVIEAMVGLLLGIILTFFALKDGARMLAVARRSVPEERREIAGRMASRAWQTLGGYLRGAAILGVVEGIVIGIAMALVGAELALPVAFLTFLMAFVPFLGAILAGALAVLVALATAGSGAAVVILIVAVVVQQFDNDLLAPVIYGSALELHPVVILLAITVGGALFGLGGGVLAVPVTAVAINLVSEARSPGEPGVAPPPGAPA